MFGNSNLIEELILLMSMGLLNSQIQDMNSYLGFERLIRDSCELLLTVIKLFYEDGSVMCKTICF